MKGQREDPSHQEEENSEDSDNPAAGTWYYEEEHVAQNNEAWEKPFAHGASSSVDRERQKNAEATWHNCLQLSIPTNQFTNAVFSMVWEIYGKYHDESMGDLNVHLAIWRMFMYPTLQALISIGKECDEISFESKKDIH